MCAAGRRRQITLVAAVVVVVDIVSDKWNCMFSDLLTTQRGMGNGVGVAVEVIIMIYKSEINNKSFKVA